MPELHRANPRRGPARVGTRRGLRLLLVTGAIASAAIMLGGGVASAHNWNGWHWNRGGSAVNVYFYVTSSGGCPGSGAANNALYDIYYNPHPIYTYCTSSHSDVHVFQAYSTASWCGLAQVWAQWWDPWNNHIDHAHAQWNTRCTSGAGFSGTAFQQGIFCQEILHTLGQEHSATSDCMNLGYFSWNQPYRNSMGNTGLYVYDWDHQSADLYNRYRYH